MLNGTIHSIFSDTGAVPAEYAALFMQSDETYSRAAIPTMPTGCTTTVSATADDGTTIDSQTLTENTFTLPLVSGKKWTVSVTMKYNGTTILSDSKEFDLTSVGAVSHEFILKPVTGGTGNVSLTLAIEATSIKYILITIPDQSAIAWTQNTISGNTNYGKWAPPGSTSFVANPTITLSNVNSGVYTATMRFYSGNDNNKALIYSTSQEINVLPTLTTNKWVSGGDVSNTLTITPTMVNAYGRTDFFVGDCGTATPDDTNGTGSPYKPLATISKAVSLISTMPTGEYTIHVKDGTTEDISSTIQINKNITIECWKNTTGDTLGIATLKWNGTSAGLMVQIISGGTLTIEGEKTADETWSGLVLDGNKDAEKRAEGISCSNGGTLNLNGGTIINCNATVSQQYGVALNISNGAVVVMNGGKISSNNANGGMGTVYLGSTDTNYPSFTMAGGIICDNNYTGSASYSPGVYISKGSFTMKDDGEITRNISSYYAGGIYISNNENAAFSMTGGKIYSNTAENKGSAIYNQGKLFISGSAYIAPDNDVYLTSGKTITIAGELTPPPEASGITATITPSSTTIGTAVLALAEGVTDTSISKERVKFNVSGTNLYIDTNGCLGEADISISSSTDQTALGNELQTNDTVIVNLQSDYVPKPLETYSNGGNFSVGKDCVVDIPAGKTLVLSSDTPVTIEPSVFSGYFFDVKGTLIIGPNITISGKSGNTSGLHWNIIAIRSGGKVILKGGTIKDCTSGGSTVGAVRIFGGGIFTMESGLITNSRGGVYIHDNGTFVMNGGEISNNTSSGVVVNSNGIFIKTGGSVKNNTNSSEPDKSQLLISAGGKYGSSNDSLTTYSEDYGLADAF